MVSKLIANFEKSIEGLETMELEILIAILRFKNIELRSIVSLLQNHTPTVPLSYSDFIKLEEFPFRIWGVVINLTRQYPKNHDSDIDDLGQIVLDLHEIVQYSVVISSPTKTIGMLNIESRSEKVSRAVVRDSMYNLGDNSNKINPLVHVDLVVDQTNVARSETVVQTSIHSDVAPEKINAACMNYESVPEIKSEEVSNVSNYPSSKFTDQSSFAKQLYDFTLVDLNYVDPYFKSYATLMNCFCKEGKLVEAHELFVEMVERGLKSNGLRFCFNDLGVTQSLVNESDLKLFDNIFVLRNILKNDEACISCIASNSSLADTNDMLKCKINVGEMKVFIFDPGPAPSTVLAAPNPQPPLPLFPALQTSLLNDMETLPSIPSLLTTTVPTNVSAVPTAFMPTNNTVAITPSSDGKLFNNHLTQTEVSAENKSSTIDITNPSDLDNQIEQEISTRGLMGISDSKSIQQETSPFKQSTAALVDSGSLINFLHPFIAPDLLKLSDPEQPVGQNIFQQHRTEISEIQNKNEGSMMESPVFVLDLMLVPLSDDSKILENLFVSDNILKPRPEFKYDLVYLKSTFEWIGGWDSVELFVDMTGRKLLQEISYGTVLISLFILEVSYQWNGTADGLQFENKIVIFDPGGILTY